MQKSAMRTAAVATAAMGLMVAGATSASATTTPASRSADHHSTTFTLVKLDSLNDSGARGVATIRLQDDNEATVRIYAHGLLADAPHAQHFHIGGAGRCPTDDDDANGDGVVSTVEGRSDYGTVGTSLTTSGDTSPASALAVKRFPTAPRGFVRYSRTLTVSDDVAADIRQGNAVVVLHGVDINGSGTYDGQAPSELDPSLPLEATAPAACGNQSLTVGVGSGLGLGLLG